MSVTAKLFMYEGGQAVRLPKEFRFEGKEVRVNWIGNCVILEPIGADESMPWAAIDKLGDAPFMPEGRDQPSLPVAVQRKACLFDS